MNVTVKNISKSYVKEKHELTIIRDFSYKFCSKKIYVFKGSSGCGKTTLLSILGLVERPASGDLWFDNTLISSLKKGEYEKLRRNNIGFVFQEPNLLERFTVKENLLLTFEGRKVEPKNAEERVEQLLDIVGLAKRADHYPFELSGGEKQRISFVRAVLQSPKILICDEPTASLDQENTRKLKDMVLKTRDEGCIVLISSHTSDFDDISDYIINLEMEIRK